MTTPTGQISLDDVNIELDIAPGTQINMDAAPVRGLAEVPTGAISMSDLQGKSNAQFVAATAGTITTSGDYKIHEFNSSDTFTVTQAGNAAGSNTVEYLVLAGGGGGGQSQGGGGGGAGGQLSNYPSPAAAGHPVSATSYPVTIGAGGAATLRGNDTIFDTITATAGGYGGSGSNSTPGQPGGSGGGATGRDYARRPGGAGNTPPKSAPATPVQGYNGGPSNSGPPSWLPTQSGGGGGGSGVIGQTNTSLNQGGAGGAGIALSITGSSVTRGGGGGGSSGNQSPSPGGSGGGGKGGASQSFPGHYAQNGTANFGGGGGGNNYSGNPVGAGGSGKVIIRYKFQ